MEGLVVVLWASLLLAGAMDHVTVNRATTPAQNLSCFQCFKVSVPGHCLPTPCAAADRVCVSHEVFFQAESRVSVTLSKRCAPRCPSSSRVFVWSLGPQVQGRISRHCCSKNLCNRAPAAGQGLGAQPGVLLLRVGLSLLLVALLAHPVPLPPATVLPHASHPSALPEGSQKESHQGPPPSALGPPPSLPP
ncbi:lymphocyte antigen 6L [Oryctolagus cuniculus]|uniref:lymphocyte antigen 6L n=1 Tax=Oryctolagus cuniculus TaxID=9986 RepID=UPI00222F332B|nr:lymphocyte antigen 6L [Oryctolagus cuniculus]